MMMRTHFSAVLYAVLLLFCSSLGHCQDQPVAIGDLNGDSKPDVVVANPSLNNVSVFLNNGSGALGPGSFQAVNGTPFSVSVADLNSDGHVDILVRTSSSGVSGLQLMLGDGHGGFAAPVAVSTGSVSPVGNTVIADFNGDGFPDIAFGINAGQPQIAIIFGDGHGGFSAPRVITVANDATSADGLVLLDANKDSKPDLVLNTASVTTNTHESFLLLNDGTGNFSVSHLSSNGGVFNPTAEFVTTVADFNGDGFVDLLFGFGSLSFIMFGDGHGGTLYTSSSLQFLLMPEGFAADFDGNKTIDLASPRLGSYFPGNGHGGFGDPISLSFPQGSTLVGVADFNGDGKPDFLLQSGTNVSVVLNNLTTPANISASTQTLLSLSAATTSVGLPVTLSASVVSYGGVPAGSVTFFDGAQSLGSTPVDIYGVAGLTTSFASAGLHNNLTASFAGTLDPNTNTVFANSNTTSPSSISVNRSQPSASAPTVTLSAFPNPARVLNNVTITANVTSPSGSPTGAVVLRADGAVVATLIPGATQGLFGPTKVTFPTVGLHNLQATYGGDATFPQATSATLVEDIRVSVPADFTIDASPQTATVRAGQSATFSITINPVGDLTSNVGFSCSGLPSASSCSFSPATLTPGINPVSTTLTLTTTAQSTTTPLAVRLPNFLVWPLTVAGFFSLLFFAIFRRRSTARQALVIWAAMACLLLTVSCGGGGSSVTPPNPPTGTPSGASSVTVTATSATSHTAALNITVTP
ncbi:MAG TPA: FG-GAP-like repeat-containing protein [Candidatus Angelobacter sp.]|jgi:hypothetical protein|nr:FG-GAP-like repeat-containing protein [Candidatus Angelobacter sp.]